MQLIDLSHTIEPGMPVYPGTPPPVFTHRSTIATHGYRELQVVLASHCGTHMDAPAHMLENGATLDRMPIDRFHGTALRLDLTACAEGQISVAWLRGFEQRLAGIDFVLLHTGWDRFWGQDGYFEGYPVLTPLAAAWLSGFDLKGVGVDTVSVDAVDAETYPVHHHFLSRGIVLIENLTGLARLPDRPVPFWCFPLKLRDADGAPVRALAAVAD